ncbi:MAG: hypothetical protein L0206_19100 [Actinobacteria bacterium]|nr:hypothetical protein [Actinomycetota bacterium]
MAVALVLAVAGAMVTAASAQDDVFVIDETEDLDFDDPQAWALKFFGSVAAFTPLGAPVVREPGSIDLGLEVTQVPHLSTAERTVGFGGRKPEDLNRLPVFVRPRVTIGLPHRFAIELGWVPPVEIDGIEPNIFSLALDHVFYVGSRWSFGGRLYGQIGGVEGDLTCSEEDASHPIGSPGNLFGCQAPSNDEATFDHVALHAGAGYQLKGSRGPTLLFGASVLRHDLEFQVDAFTFSVHDRSLLLTEGTTWALDAGIAIPAAQRAQVGIEVLWSPLEVVRPPKTTAENDDLLHVKALLRYRVR